MVERAANGLRWGRHNVTYLDQISRLWNPDMPNRTSSEAVDAQTDAFVLGGVTGHTRGCEDVKRENLLTLCGATPSAGEGPAFPGAERQVEFVGPPGVGKSAIYHAALARLGKQGIYRTVQAGWFLAATASL